MTRHVVIGASGFIGSAIARHLSSLTGGDVRGVSSDDVDLRRREAALAHLGDGLAGATLIHAAGIPRLRADNMDALRDNLAINESVIAACERARPARIVYLSSVEVYGAPERQPIRESTEILPETLYGISKVLGELLLQRWAAAEGVPLCILRLPGVYGPGDKARGLVGALARCTMDQTPFTLTGNTANLRDYVFVEDVARGVAALLPGIAGRQVYNFASGASATIEDIMAAIQKVLGPCRIERRNGSSPTHHLSFDTTALRKALPAFVFTPLHEGIGAYKTAIEPAA